MYDDKIYNCVLILYNTYTFLKMITVFFCLRYTKKTVFILLVIVFRK